MENRRNYYRILHIQPDAPEALIKASYRTLMQKLKLHPDLGGSHWNAALINEAYRVLSDHVKRRAYDKALLADLVQHRQMEAQEETGADNIIYPAHEFKPASEFIQCYCLFCKTPYLQDALHRRSRYCLECECPLPLNNDEHLHDDQQRLVERKHQEGTINYYTYWPDSPHDAEIMDLSPKGICFASHQDLTEETLLKIDSELFRAVAKVTHTEVLLTESNLDFSVGAEFLAVIFEEQRGNFLSVDV